jgi:hypothetical protein
MASCFGRPLVSGGTRGKTAGAAVITYSASYSTIDDCCVVHIVDLGHIYIHDGTIVEELVPLPSAPFEAFSVVAESIVDATIETDLSTPIALMEDVRTFVPTPPWRGPQVSGMRS